MAEIPATVCSISMGNRMNVSTIKDLPCKWYLKILTKLQGWFSTSDGVGVLVVVGVIRTLMTW